MYLQELNHFQGHKSAVGLIQFRGFATLKMAGVYVVPGRRSLHFPRCSPRSSGSTSLLTGAHHHRPRPSLTAHTAGPCPTPTLPPRHLLPSHPTSRAHLCTTPVTYCPRHPVTFAPRPVTYCPRPRHLLPPSPTPVTYARHLLRTPTPVTYCPRPRPSPIRHFPALQLPSPFIIYHPSSSFIKPAHDLQSPPITYNPRPQPIPSPATTYHPTPSPTTPAQNPYHPRPPPTTPAHNLHHPRPQPIPSPPTTYRGLPKNRTSL
nr:extensin-like [Penaeus vannamei]